MPTYEEYDSAKVPKPLVKRRKYVSLLTHTIELNDGTCIKPSGKKAYIEFDYGAPDTDLVMSARVKRVANVPDARPDTLYIVSGMIAKHLCRPDVVSPASNHRDREFSKDTSDKYGAKILRVPGLLRHLRDQR